ncbi:MAG: alpha/beta hydrolase [Anaerolineae bacterium]|nr:alpha/beta hydrolase [Anaerolineae bacterium]
MTDTNFDELYADANERLREALRRFRENHPPKEIEVGEWTWEYLDGGAGGAVVLILPGGVRYGETYFQLIGTLESNYRVIAPSYPGVTTVAEIVDGLVAILDAEGIEKVHVIGKAFGGGVAQVFAQQHPERIGKLVLSNTAGRYLSAYTKRVKNARNRARLFPQSTLRSAYLQSMLGNMKGLEEEDRAFYAAFFKELVERESKQEALAMYDCTIDLAQNFEWHVGDLTNWGGSVLIIESENDEAISAGRREALRDLYPEAQVHTFENAGHMASMVQPAAYQSVVLGFLGG